MTQDDRSKLQPVTPTTNRQVEVTEQDRHIRYYDANGTLRDIGKLVTEQFEGENIARNRITGAQYRDDLDLGIKKGTSHPVVSPHRYQEALTEAGINVQKVYQHRGTVTVVAEKTDATPLEDLITWDHGLWNKVWLTP